MTKVATTGDFIECALTKAKMALLMDRAGFDVFAGLRG